MKFEEIVNEVKRRTDLVSVISKFVVLSKTGSNYLGLCPFHVEKTPSLSVKTSDNYFRCFGCDVSGDVFTFLQKKTGLTFFNAVQKLAGELNIQLGTNSYFHARKQSVVLLEEAQVLFQKNLQGAPLLYLTKERGYCFDVIKKLGLGFGILNNNPMLSSFNSRITIPIRDQYGVLVGFGGRALAVQNSKTPKYINSSSSDLFEKNRVLYGLYESLNLIRKYKNVVVVEGYFDVIALLSIGIPCVALCGVALSLHHINLLKKYVSEVTLCFDQDSAGMVVRKKALMKFLNNGFFVKDMKLSQKDPDIMLRIGSAKEIIDSYNGARDAVQVEIENTLSKSLGSVSNRIQGLQNIIPFLFAHPDELVNRQYIKLAAKLFQEDETAFYKYTKTLKIDKSESFSKNFDSVEFCAIKWTEQEKLILRVLTNYPQTLKNNKQILNTNINPDLLFFIEKMIALKINESYLTIKLPRSSSVMENLDEIFNNPIHLSMEEGIQIIQDLIFTTLQKRKNDLLRTEQENLLPENLPKNLDVIKKILPK